MAINSRSTNRRDTHSSRSCAPLPSALSTAHSTAKALAHHTVLCTERLGVLSAGPRRRGHRGRRCCSSRWGRAWPLVASCLPTHLSRCSPRDLPPVTRAGSAAGSRRSRVSRRPGLHCDPVNPGGIAGQAAAAPGRPLLVNCTTAEMRIKTAFCPGNAQFQGGQEPFVSSLSFFLSLFLFLLGGAGD